MHVGSFAPCESSGSFGFYVFWAYKHLLLRIIVYGPLCCKRALGVGVSLDRNVGQTDGKIKVFFLCFRVPPQLYTITDPIILRVQNGHCPKKILFLCSDLPILFMLIFFYFRDMGVALKQENLCLKSKCMSWSNHSLLILLIFSFLAHWHHGTIDMALLLWSVASVTITIMIRCNCNNWCYDPLQWTE